MKAIALVVLMAGCATPRKPCEFSVSVRVTDDADGECRDLGAKWSDSGKSIPLSARIFGCATNGKIITDGTTSNAGHELAHQIERNCR